MRGRRTLMRGTVGIAAAVFLGAAGFAVASTLSSGAAATTAVIHACVGPAGAIRIVASAGTCKPTEHELTWDVQGPQGIQGKTGPQGIPGKTGPTGPKGAPGSGVTLADAGSNCANGGIAVSAAATTTYVCNGAAGSPGSPGTTASLAGSPCAFPEGGPDGTVSVSVAPSSHVVSLYCAGFVGTSTSTPTTTTQSCSPPPPQNHATYGCDGSNVVIVSCDPGYVNYYGETGSAFEEEFGCVADPNEPNNTQATAATLAWPSIGNTSSTGDNYVSGTDDDWYTFTAQPGQGGNCSVGFSWSTITAPGSGINSGAVIDLYRDGTLIGAVNDNTSNTPLPTTDTPGTCSTYLVHARYEGFMALWNLTITNNGS